MRISVLGVSRSSAVTRESLVNKTAGSLGVEEGVVVDDEGLEVVAGVEERDCLDALEEKLTKLQLE